MQIKEKTIKKTGKKYEMFSGYNCNGKTIYLICATPDTSYTMHRFTTLAEAEHWWKHACK